MSTFFWKRKLEFRRKNLNWSREIAHNPILDNQRSLPRKRMFYWLEIHTYSTCWTRMSWITATGVRCDTTATVLATGSANRYNGKKIFNKSCILLNILNILHYFFLKTYHKNVNFSLWANTYVCYMWTRCIAVYIGIFCSHHKFPRSYKQVDKWLQHM